jgi:hypothetical protein
MATSDDEAAFLQQIAAMIKTAQDAEQQAAAARARVQAAAAVLEKERATAAALEEQAVTAAKQMTPPPYTGAFSSPTLEPSGSYEATVVANLHLQAAGVQNIRSLVPVTLEPSSTNFATWHGHLLTLKRYALTDHVLADSYFPNDPAWDRMDSIVLSWIFGTVSIELQERHGTARQAWLALENHFIGNRKTRALHLDATFRNFVQGDLTVGEYCRKMKGFADALSDLDAPVSDRILVLNVLRGLNPKYANLRTIITRFVPFPTFHKVRDDLVLEEIVAGAVPPDSAASALYTSTAAPSASSPARPPAQGTHPPAQGGVPGSSAGRRNKNRRHGHGRGGGSPWPSVYNPWTGTIHMWPGSMSAGSSPRPGQQYRPPGPSQSYLAAPGLPTLQAGLLGPPPAPMPAPTAPPAPQPWSPWTGSWDQRALANTFSTKTLQPPATITSCLV